MPVEIPENAVWWQQLLAWTLISIASASMPIIIAWLNRIHHSLSDNTLKTEKIEHAVNGSLSARLKDLSNSITGKIEEHLTEIDTRLKSIEMRVTSMEAREKDYHAGDDEVLNEESTRGKARRKR
jgi:hypothetical protein